MDSKKIIDEIRKYYMNPKSYPNENKKKIEEAISLMDSRLKGGNGISDDMDLISTLCTVYSSDESNTPINTLMHQSRADEDGVAATRGYKEIYFNEVVQNANDNTNGNYLNVYVNKEEEDQCSIIYSLVFEYEDPGFSVENVIGLFNSEIHTKKSNLSATGKHGVGIKALFYFVDTLIIESNIIATFNIRTINEDGVEKIQSASSRLEVNKNWDHRKTHLTIKYRNKDSYGEFNVGKLNTLIDGLCDVGDSLIPIEKIKSFFFDESQTQLVFDCRALLFMDKNKGKEKGITQLSFFYNSSKRFTISVDKNESDKIENNGSGYIIGQYSIRYNEKSVLSYLVVTMESEGDQNFSIAFPNTDKISKGDARFYETYYIPEGRISSQDHQILISFNVLINSKYSSVDRRKLTDDDKKEAEIADYINKKTVAIFKQLTSSQMQEAITKEAKPEVSKLFHNFLLLDENFISLCYQNKIDNRYLLKFKCETNSNEFIIYQRAEKEPYEKKLLGQSLEVNKLKDFFEDNIIGEEAVKYDENLFLDIIIKKAYIIAFNDSSKEQLRAVLNAIGEIKDLIKYRITGSQYCKEIYEQIIDDWISGFEIEQQVMALSLIGRYKIHPGVSANGEIISASFYEYLFSEEENVMGVFAQKQQQEYSGKYDLLKRKLCGLLVNREESGTAKIYGKSSSYSSCDYRKGEVAFFASWDGRNPNFTVVYDTNAWTVYDYPNASNTQSFGNELFDLLLERFSMDPDMCKHVKRFDNKLMITSSKFPQWGSPQGDFDSNRFIWSTGEWFKSKVINLNFMTHLVTDNMSQLREYVVYFVRNKKNWGDFKFRLSASINYSDNTLIELMDIFYRYDLTNQDNSIFYCISVEIKGVSSVSNDNLCPQDYFNFIYNMTGLNVMLAQVANIQPKGKELIFLYGDSVKIFKDDEWKEISKVNNNNEQQVIVFFNERLDWNKAISLVLKEICKEKDTIEKCEAFIPQNQGIAIWGEQFTKIQDSDYFEELRSRKVILSDSASKMSVAQLKYIITARGNNNNSCGCCGKPLKKHNLIIIANTFAETKSRYPHIVNVVCDECYILLKKSHKESKVIEDSIKGIIVEHKCLLQNSHQQKEILKKYRICSGIASILYKNK